MPAKCICDRGSVLRFDCDETVYIFPNKTGDGVAIKTRFKDYDISLEAAKDFRQALTNAIAAAYLKKYTKPSENPSEPSPATPAKKSSRRK